MNDEELKELSLKLLYLLRYLHTKKLLLLSTKPEDILYEPISRDFTLVNISSLIHKSEKVKINHLKMGYVAPETLNEGMASQQSDIFSIGALLLKCLNGKGPFEGSTYIETINNNRQLNFKNLNFEKNADIKRFLTKMLSENPKDR
mmetsp:Transcript_27894/g.39171  ORF Transcript_27894/g.39171 Transcript_27894/m.39171 type:complete len:146 (+) Transcript_27894:593-1030(+)